MSYRGITSKNGFTDEIGEVKRVADVCHPAKEIGQTHHAQGAGHHYDGLQVVTEGQILDFVAALYCVDAGSTLIREENLKMVWLEELIFAEKTHLLKSGFLVRF